MIQQFYKGQRVGAADLNQLVGVLNKFEAMVGDGNVRVSRTPNGTTLSISPDLLGRLRGAVTTFWAKIGSSAEADSPAINRWLYAFTEQTRTAAGYGGWSTKANGTTGTTSSNPARNFVEDMNDGLTVEGNGVDLDNLDTADYTFTIQACPSGVVVLMHEVKFNIGETSYTEYWFSYENGVDGTCD